MEYIGKGRPIEPNDPRNEVAKARFEANLQAKILYYGNPREYAPDFRVNLENKRAFLDGIKGKNEQDSGVFSIKYTEDLLSRPKDADRFLSEDARKSLFEKPRRNDIPISEVKKIMQDYVEQKEESSSQGNVQSNA